jgi:MFS family permease
MPEPAGDSRRWWILAAMTGTLSMMLLDSTVVSVALPSIQADLDMGQTELQWVVNAYLLALPRSWRWPAGSRTCSTGST